MKTFFTSLITMLFVLTLYCSGNAQQRISTYRYASSTTYSSYSYHRNYNGIARTIVIPSYSNQVVLNGNYISVTTSVGGNNIVIQISTSNCQCPNYPNYPKQTQNFPTQTPNTNRGVLTQNKQNVPGLDANGNPTPGGWYTYR